MPRFAANISFMFTELPFLERFGAAADAGFRGVEFHYPYEFDPRDVRLRLEQHGLTPVLMNIRAGDASKGEWGLAGVPGREQSFRLCAAEAIEYAVAIGVKQLNCLAGVRAPDHEARNCELVLIDNLRDAARECASAGLFVNLEPINTIDVPGYLIDSTLAAIRVMDATGAKNLMLQYDCYHMQVMEGGGADAITATIESLLPRIGHIQFADVPGRHELGTGGIDFTRVFAEIDRLTNRGNYAGWVSAEYRPSPGRKTEETLAWLGSYESENRE